MILSQLIHFESPAKYLAQRIDVKCDNCSKIFNSALRNQEKGINKYKQDLCRSCKQREQIASGIRDTQYVNTGISAKRNLTGKTFTENYISMIFIQI